MNNRIDVCEVCGSKLVDFIDDQCCGLKCPVCNRPKVVTTYSDPFLYDERIYDLYLYNNDYSAKKAYILSKILKINVNEASKMLVSDNVLLMSDKTIELKQIIILLKENGINFYIKNFPYEIKNIK